LSENRERIQKMKELYGMFVKMENDGMREMTETEMAIEEKIDEVKLPLVHKTPVIHASK